MEGLKVEEGHGSVMFWKGHLGIVLRIASGEREWKQCDPVGSYCSSLGGKSDCFRDLLAVGCATGEKERRQANARQLGERSCRLHDGDPARKTVPGG